jgi:hypothetical protein
LPSPTARSPKLDHARDQRARSDDHPRAVLPVGAPGAHHNTADNQARVQRPHSPPWPHRSPAHDDSLFAPPPAPPSSDADHEHERGDQDCGPERIFQSIDEHPADCFDNREQRPRRASVRPVQAPNVARSANAHDASPPTPLACLRDGARLVAVFFTAGSTVFLAGITPPPGSLLNSERGATP